MQVKRIHGFNDNVTLTSVLTQVLMLTPTITVHNVTAKTNMIAKAIGYFY